MSEDNRKTSYSGRYLTMSEEEIGGHVYERVTLRPGVKVIPCDDDGKVLLIREKKLNERAPRWKLISGWMDKAGKDALAVAQEELAEEAGMAAEEWQEYLHWDKTGFTIEQEQWFFICRGLSRLEDPPENPDQGTISEMMWVGMDELFGLVDNRDMLWDSDTMVVIQILREQRNAA